MEVRDTDVTFVPPSDATMAEGTTTTRANDAGSSCTKEFQLKMEGSPTPTVSYVCGKEREEREGKVEREERKVEGGGE